MLTAESTQKAAFHLVDRHFAQEAPEENAAFQFDSRSGQGTVVDMQWRKRIRFEKDGVSVAADLNAAVAINQGEAGGTEKVDAVSHVRVVQSSRGTAQDRSEPGAPETGTQTPLTGAETSNTGAETPKTDQENENG